MARKLFITPPDDPEAHYTRCIRVPASQEWLAVFNRALLQLSEPGEWEQLNETDLTPEEAAAICYDVYVDWLSGECSLDCNDVLACVQTVIEQLVSQGATTVNLVDPNDADVIENRFPTATRNTAVLPPPAECSQDAVWSGIKEIVDRIDANGLDFWETVDAQTDAIERVAEIITLVPILGDLVGDALLLLADIADDMKNAYASFQTETLREEIACDLFALVCAECRFPTYQEIYDYYAGNSAAGAEHWETLALQALVDVLIGTATASAGIIYYTTNILQMWVLGAAATWLETFGVRFIALWAGLGASSPSDNWELLCGPCGTPPEPCDGFEEAITTRYGCTYTIDAENPCLYHFTSGPAQADGDYYIALDTRQLSTIDFRLDVGATSGLALINCRWSLDGGAGHFTNLAGLEAVTRLDDFYIRSNTPWSGYITFTPVT